MAGDIRKRIDELTQQVEKDLPKHAYDYFKKVTPKRTGNARMSTDFDGDEIHANYPYAKRLDEGHSKQAPRGMTQPTIEEVQRYIKNKIRKA